MPARPPRPVTTVDVDELHEKIERLEAKVDALSSNLRSVAQAIVVLTEVLTDPPAVAGGRMRPKLTPAQAADDRRRRTFKARIARAAKRYGFTVEEWIERYGEVDRLPPGLPRPRGTRVIQ